MWKTLSEKVVHKNNWYKIIHKKFELPSKKKGDYFIVETTGSVAIIPVKNNKIIFEKLYRYPTNSYNLELPMGGINIHRNPLKAAKEELEEEIGYKADKMIKIGKFIPFTGISSEICYVFLAINLNFTGTKKEDTEFIKPVEVEIKKAYEMIDNGKIKDGMTIAALSLAKKYLLKK